jgi:murein DD-endopeptidase / murein LD-carboxypeptidase
MILFSSCISRKKISHTSPLHSLNNTHLDISNKLNEEIRNWIGVPYKLGGNDKKGIDCSGLVCIIYKNVYGKILPRMSLQQYEGCKKNALKEGDLVFFNPGKGDVSHVGIYLKDHQFIHASVSKGVVISTLDNTYYKKYFVSGGRI